MSGNLQGYQQVADAIGLTAERELASGVPWCPPRDAIAVRRWVVDRGPELGSNIRRVVRLARLMQIADGKDYARFLYVRISALRAREFKAALQSAAKTGVVPASVAHCKDAGIALHEAEGAQPFEINFAQMPRLAALLDMIHNCLGFQPVRKLLEPLWAGPSRTPTEVARELQATLGGWLNERLESLTHSRQAQRMWSFLAGRGPVTVDAITNEAILEFWSSVGSVPASETVDGFRLFTSSARAMLRYRGALAEAEGQAQIERGLSGGNEADVRALDIAERGIDTDTTDVYRSPLAVLASARVDKVKWLTQRESDHLQHAFGNNGTAEETDGDSDEGRALMPGRPFDTAFSSTLRRADVFGAVQASIVARVRKRLSGEDAIAQVYSEMPDNAYKGLAQQYEEVRQQLYLEGLAATLILMEAGRAEAVFLLRELADASIIDALLGGMRHQIFETPGEQVRIASMANIGAVLKAASADPSTAPEPARVFLAEARAAVRRVNRAGFRKEDRLAPAYIEALAMGAPTAMKVASELNRLVAGLRLLGDETFSEDRQVFQEGFRRLYSKADQQ